MIFIIIIILSKVSCPNFSLKSFKHVFIVLFVVNTIILLNLIIDQFTVILKITK